MNVRASNHPSAGKAALAAPVGKAGVFAGGARRVDTCRLAGPGNVNIEMLKKTVLPFDDRHEIRVNWFAPADNNHLFNEARFFHLHAQSTRDVYAQLTRIGDEKVYATLSFFDDGDNRFSSPKRGTFGGIGLNHAMDAERVEKFLDLIIAHLVSVGASSLQIKLPPLSHDLASGSVVTNLLLRRQWTLSAQELNCDLVVDTRPLIERVDDGNAKRIRKCEREHFHSGIVARVDLPKVYRVISENRERRGHAMTMTLPQLETMADAFPTRTVLFGVYRDQTKAELVASAVCLAISPSILYVFYWGDVAGMESHSPIALLASKIYEHCQREHITVLDAGTSTVAGQPNYGLLHFKRGLGFSESLKLSFAWSV